MDLELQAKLTQQKRLHGEGACRPRRAPAGRPMKVMLNLAI
jgi:hypothetical protein